jgi:hypothetical protein
MADITIDVNPQQSTIDATPSIQTQSIPIDIDGGQPITTIYWGDIRGTLSNQTDLQAALDAIEAEISGKQDTIPDADKILKNNTTQTNGLAILGSVSDIAGTAVGDGATARRASVTVGHNAVALNYGVAIGGTDSNNIKTSANASSVAIGYGAVCNGSNAAQIGIGQNDTGGTLQFQDYRLLNADGSIPNERIPILSNKANVDLSNIDTTISKLDNVLPSGIDYVIDYKASTSEDPTWYRVYRSGWVEQGGRLPGGSGSYTGTVLLQKEMADTLYNISIIALTGGGGVYSCVKGTITTTSFTYSANESPDGGFSWEVKGQKATI